MVSNLNLNNINVGDDGRVSFCGTVSGIDTRSAIDNIIAAKRIPVDRIEAEIDTNLQRNALPYKLRSTIFSTSLKVVTRATTKSHRA